MASYEYDESGQSYFFVLTFLLLVLIPYTYSVVRSSAGSRIAPPPCVGWNVKDRDVVRGRSSTAGLKKSHVALSVGWLLAAWVMYQASFVKAAANLYDPFAILGISTSLDEKAIKKHYKRLSLKFHPDKLRLKENQTIEDANAHFVDLTKAYKALTDETTRRNFELYGHPDGKRDTSMGIALPKWIVESKNNGWVIGIYGLAFGILLPYFVGRWWAGSRKYTKDQCLTASAELYFFELKEDTTFPQALEVLSASAEFKAICDPKGSSDAAGGRVGKGGKEWKRLEDEVKRKLAEVNGAKIEGKMFQGRQYAKRSAVLLYAHLFRVPINDSSLLKEKNVVVTTAHQLIGGMQSIALSRNWLSTLLVLISLQQHLVQAFHPSLPRLLQLPFLSAEAALKAQGEANVSSPEEFAVLDEEARTKAMGQVVKPGEEKAAVAVARKWPKLELVSAEFKVVGEKFVTPGCFIQFIVKVRIPDLGAPESSTIADQANGHANGSSSVSSGVAAPEAEIDELIGRRKKGADGERTSPWAHAPHFPTNRKPTYYLFIGDHKLNRVFVHPIRFTDLGYSTVRTVKHTFQAPPNPGLYTFQAYIASDSYVGTDLQLSMSLKVSPPLEGQAGQGEEDDDDDISDPEEDTIAGQMAAMRGLPTKRRSDADDEDDEDTSATESSDSDSTTTTDSSDSESE